MTMITYQTYGAGTVRAPQTTASSRLGACIALFRRVRERQRQRRALRDLDDHLLRDIGKSRREALAEASKPFWRR